MPAPWSWCSSHYALRKYVLNTSPVAVSSGIGVYDASAIALYRCPVCQKCFRRNDTEHHVSTHRKDEVEMWWVTTAFS